MKEGSVIVGPVYGTRYVVKRRYAGSDDMVIEPVGGGIEERWTARGLERDGYRTEDEDEGA
jgi:hypothetical protein